MTSFMNGITGLTIIWGCQGNLLNITRCDEYEILIQTNIPIYLYPKKNDTNEYPNIFVSKKLYKYDTNEYLYWKIFDFF